MTLWKMSDTRITCMINQTEIEILGYTVEELARNDARTEEFLQVILQKGKEMLGLKTEYGVKAFHGVVLPDKSLLLTIVCNEKPVMMLEEERKTYQILFSEADLLIQFCSIMVAMVEIGDQINSRLYYDQGIYYLIIDIFSNEKDILDFLSRAEEFGGIVEQDYISESFLKEHEALCIEEKAIQKLGF